MSRLTYHLSRFNEWDIDLCQACNDLSRNHSVRSTFKIFSRLGDGMFWYALMASLLVVYREAALHAVLHMLAAGIVSTALYKLIKQKTLRPRPFNVYPSIVCNGHALDQFSFPSGHTLHAVSFSMVAIAYFPALAWLVVPFSLMVAISRPVLGLHYPSDVLVGALIGALIAALSFYL